MSPKKEFILGKVLSDSNDFTEKVDSS
jgi:hypothetical protein